MVGKAPTLAFLLSLAAFGCGVRSRPAATRPSPTVSIAELKGDCDHGRWGACEMLASDPSVARIPVIILTTSGNERDVKACYEAGANTYVQKPVTLDGLIDAIRRLKEFWFEIALLPKDGEGASQPNL